MEEVFTISTKLSRPIIGVLISNGLIDALNKQNHDFRSYFRLQQLAHASRKTRIPVFFFGVNDVDLKNKRVNGTYYDHHTHKWRKRNFPFPDILYDRGGGFEGNQRRKAKWVRTYFNKRGIKPLNSQHFFNKWDVYKKLSKESHIRSHLPETKRLRNIEDLQEFLEKYNKVYIKGVNGSRGKQVMRIQKSSNGGYVYSHYGTRLVKGEKNSVRDLYQYIKAFYRGRKVIIQQAISLMKIDGRLIDLRAEVQRNKNGKLEVVAIPVRLGIPNSPITIHSDAYEFDQFFKKYKHFTNDEISKLKNKIDDFLIQVYQSIEKYYGPFAEMGIDLGLDKNLNIWFIESNAKSAKVSLGKACSKQTIKKAFVNPLRYAKYIYEHSHRTS